MVAKWKYANPKKKNYEQYLRFETDIPKNILITGWNFQKNEYTQALFFADILEEDKIEVSKVWSVWNKLLRDDLKKLLKKFDPYTDKVRLKITFKVNNAVDVYKVRVLKT